MTCVFETGILVWRWTDTQVMFLKITFWDVSIRLSASAVPKSCEEALRPWINYVSWASSEPAVGGLLQMHWKDNGNTLPWVEPIRFITGIVSGTFRYSVDVLFHLKTSHRDDGEKLDLHEPCHALQSGGQSPFLTCSFGLVEDFVWRPLLSFPFLFLERLGALLSPSDWNKDYEAALRTVGCVFLKIHITY